MQKRNIKLDALRVFAVFSVLSVHYFLYSGFYDTPMVGKRMLFMGTARQFFMICVPLFIMLTGYLMSHKKLNRKYFRGIRKTLFIYIGASIVCMVFKTFYLEEPLHIKNMILGILDFTGAQYSWYIEMYIGLFLLIPFINLIYNGLKEKKQKQLLILIFLFLTGIPSLTNIYNFSDLSWWINPATSDTYQKLLPYWWYNCYPLTYYFIGAYLKEYGLCLNKKLSILLLGITIVFSGTFNYYRMFGGTFLYGIWTDYSSILVVIMSTLVFNIFCQMTNLNSAPIIIQKALEYLSNWALGAYLLSYIFDTLIYTYLQENIGPFNMEFKYYFFTIPPIFICSMVSSALLNYILILLQKCSSHMKKFKSSKQNKI